MFHFHAAPAARATHNRGPHQFTRLCGNRLRLRLLVMACLMLPSFLQGCSTDESLAAYGAAGKTWTLTELNGEQFSAPATLSLLKAGKLTGQAPCNRYHASQGAPYPWFEIKSLAATRRVCPELLAEAAFLQALQTMSQAEVAGDTLILRNEDGHEMIFANGT